MTQAVHIGFQGDHAEALQEATALVDVAAGKTRGRYITTIPGQAEIYQEKAAAAERYLASRASSPWVKDEAEARMILTKREEWQAKSAAIERVRIEAKTGIRRAESAREAFAIAQDARAKLDAL